MSEMSLSEALSRRRTRRVFSTAAIPQSAVERLLWAAQGRTDDAGNRTAPSAHGLHPLRLRLSIGAVSGLAAGLYDADPQSLRLRVLSEADNRVALEQAAIGEQPWVAAAACVLTLYADMDAVTAHFAEQPPAGERGARYAFIEAGAAAQNALLAAAELDLGAALVAGFDDRATCAALGLEPPFLPLLHLCVGAAVDD